MKWKQFRRTIENITAKGDRQRKYNPCITFMHKTKPIEDDKTD